VTNAHKVLFLERLEHPEGVLGGGRGGLHLFPGEYVLVEVKLDLLVGDVDAELLEGVLLEVLEPEDVQDADVQAVLLLSGKGGGGGERRLF